MLSTSYHWLSYNYLDYILEFRCLDRKRNFECHQLWNVSKDEHLSGSFHCLWFQISRGYNKNEHYSKCLPCIRYKSIVLIPSLPPSSSSSYATTLQQPHHHNLHQVQETSSSSTPLSLKVSIMKSVGAVLVYGSPNNSSNKNLQISD